MRLCTCLSVLLAALAGAAPFAARADELDVGANLAVGVATHQESGAGATAAAGVPFADLAYRTGPWQVHAEALPTSSGEFSQNGSGFQSVRLSYDEATLRYWIPRSRFALGIGETLRNQRSLYLFPVVHGTDRVDAASRGAGTRYEALATLPLGTLQHLELDFTDSPSMHASFALLLEPSTLPRVTVPESGALLDAHVQEVVTLKHGDFYYGIRYIHLSMDLAEGVLADRDLVWASYAGWDFRFNNL